MVKLSRKGTLSMLFVLAASGCSNDTTDLDPIDHTGSPIATSEQDAGALVSGNDAATLAPSQTTQAADAAVDASADHDPGDDAGRDGNQDQHDADVGGNDMADAGADAASASDASNVSDASDPVQIVADGTLASVLQVVTLSCAGCHGAGKSLDFSTATTAYDTMVNVPASMKACAATDGGTPWVRVVPGDLANSLLIQKIEGHAPCGNQMPIKGLLPDALAEVFRAWVSAGAPQL